MGNSIGGRKKAKVMTINGETLKFKTPVRAWEVIKDCPGHVLLESEAVKRYGTRAKPLEPEQQLIPKKIYFIVELPKSSSDHEKVQPRALRSQSSGIHMSAKDRLECLMLSRRTVSDLSINRAPSVVSDRSGHLKVKLRLPSDQVAKLVAESRDGVEVAEKILDIYRHRAGEVNGDVPEGKEDALIQRPEAPWKPALGSIGEKTKAHKVLFLRTCLDILRFIFHVLESNFNHNVFIWTRKN